MNRFLTSNDALFLLGTRDIFIEEKPDLRSAPTGSTETPLPRGAQSPFLVDFGTRAHAFPADVGAMVSASAAYVSALAVIPVDEAVSARVDADIETHDTAARTKRSLSRKT